MQGNGQSVTAVRARLWAASAVMLFVELALIRWAGANVIHLSYFSNFVLLGSFLGIGLGFLLPADTGRWLKLLAPVPLALLVVFVRTFPVQVRQNSDQVLYFTAVEPTGLPEWVTLPALFLLTAIIMAGLGKIVADLFRRLPSLDAYRFDLLGSLSGSILFAVLSLLRAPSVVWGIVTAVGLLALAGWRARLMYAVPLGVVVVALALESATPGISWSPYYKIKVIEGQAPGTYQIFANGVPHQGTASLEAILRPGSRYQQPYTETPDNPHRRVLVIGAGNGNDVAAALAHGAERVDAVEIDPRLQQIGKELHSAKPYDDPRVHVYINDGRAFLEQTDARYDLIVMALPDSLTLVAGASNLRLESYLFTRQAFEAVHEHLNPAGAFGMYNYYRQDWLVDRFAGSLAETFGHPPCMTRYGSGRAAIMVAGMSPADQSCTTTWRAVGEVPPPVSDDRPFPYLRHPTIPTLYLGVLGAILLVTVVSVRVAGVRLRRTVRYTDMFLMGAAFLLLETKNVIGFALYFGTTWLVNALVFIGVLLAVLLAVEVRRRMRRVNQRALQLLLFATIAVAWLVPAHVVLGLPVPARLAAAIALAFAPIFCANLIFSDRLAQAADPAAAFGANLLGALTGGTLEYLALVTGYRALLLVVALLYAGAFVAMRIAGTRWPASEPAAAQVAVPAS